MNAKLQKAIAIITSVYSVLLGASFIACALHLFFTGGATPYTMERCGEYLTLLAIPSVIFAILVILGFATSKEEGVKPVYKYTRSELLEIFKKRVDESKLDTEIKAKLDSLRTRKAILIIVAYVLSAILLAAALFYILTFNFTSENLNGDVISALVISLPLSLVAIFLHLPFGYFIERFSDDEYSLLKANRQEIMIESKNIITQKSKKSTAIITAFVFALGVAFMILGYFNGGIGDVFGKAVKICTECIGLG